MKTRVLLQKSGYFTKLVRNLTIRKVNYSNHLEKWYIKVSIIVLKCEMKILQHNPFICLCLFCKNFMLFAGIMSLNFGIA